MNHFFQFISEKATIKNVVIGFLLIVLFNAFLLPFLPELIWGFKMPISKILDLKFSYTLDVCYNLFDEIGANGRNSYQLSELFIDTPYAIVYSFTYAISIYLLLKANDLVKFKILIVTPILIGIFDILENLGIVTMLMNFPEKLVQIAQLTSAATSLKWLFAMITFLIILLNILKITALKALGKI